MIDAVVNIKSVLSAVERVKHLDRRKVWRDARKPVRISLRAIAKAQTAPDGRWPALAASTLERRARGGKRRRSRKLLGRLPSAIAMTSGSNFVRAESRAKFSNVHQQGGAAGHGARIAQRMFMWIPRTLVRAVRDIYRGAVSSAWGR